MGLDMYLTKKTYIGAEYEHRNVKGIINITIEDKPININFNRVNYIEESVAYWRKANQIHKWFVDNIQKGEDDCKDYYVSREQLQELVALCQKVLDKELTTEDNLPCQSGFFFGSTEYDEYYFEDLKNTIEQLTPLLKEEGEFYYTSSW